VRVSRGVGQVIADLAQLGDGLARARHVGERDRRAAALLLLAASAELRESGETAGRGVLADPHEEREQAHQDQDRQQELDDHLTRRLVRLLVHRHRRAARVEGPDQGVELGVRGRIGGPADAPVLGHDHHPRILVEELRGLELLVLGEPDHGRERHAGPGRRRLGGLEQREEEDGEHH
jgi:hypothetical protein